MQEISNTDKIRDTQIIALNLFCVGDEIGDKIGGKNSNFGIICEYLKNHSVLKYYFVVWRKSFDFKGRSTRKEYWIFFLIDIILFPIIFAFLNIFQNLLVNLSFYFVWHEIFAIAAHSISILRFLLIPISLGHIWTLLPLTVRRIRDVGMKWQWIFFVSIPLVGFIFVLIFLTRNSLEDINGKKYFPKY